MLEVTAIYKFYQMSHNYYHKAVTADTQPNGIRAAQLRFIQKMNFLHIKLPDH